MKIAYRAALVLVFVILGWGEAPVFAQSSFVEDFTSTAARDAAVSTADWDTVAGELRLFPFEPTVLGGCDTSGMATNVACDGRYAYVADGNAGLQVVDFREPSLPVVVSTLPISRGTADDIAVSGDLAFVAARDAGLQVVGIRDPLAPEILGSFDTTGMAWSVAVSGDMALVVDRPDSLLIIDVSDPAQPVRAGAVGIPGDAIDVAVSGDLALVTDGASLQLVDISDRAAPVIVGSRPSLGFAYGVAVDGDMAFVADGSAGLQLVDITDPENPLTMGQCDTPGYACQVAVAGDCAYVGDTGGGLQVIDVSAPATPTVIGTCATAAYTLAAIPCGEVAITAEHTAGVRAIRINHLVRHGLTGTAPSADFAMDVVATGNLAFVADRNAGLRILDITDLSAPTLKAAIDTPGSATRLAVSGDLVFVADDTAGLRIIDVRDPSLPAPAGSRDTPGRAVDVALAGDLAYVADGTSGLQIIGFGDPAAPDSVGSADTPGFANGVAVAGDLAFVADGESGLRIFDITDPSNPAPLGGVDTPGYVHSVFVSGDIAYVADRTAGLQIIDIEDPDLPFLRATYPMPGGEAYDVVVVGEYAHVTTNAWTLLTIDVSDPDSPFLAGSFFHGAWGADGLAVFGDQALLAGRFSGLIVARILQHEFDATRFVGRSLPVDGADDPILKVRLTASQTESVQWRVTTGADADFTTIPPDGTWSTPPGQGADLRWNASLAPVAPGVNPTVTSLRLEWLNEFATIAKISDVPDDQGGRVDVTISRSGYDFADETGYPVTGYNLYRRVDASAMNPSTRPSAKARDTRTLKTTSGGDAWPLPGVESWSDGDAVYVSSGRDAGLAGELPPGTWKLVGTAFATQSDTYLMEAATAADSTSSGTGWSVYLVTTHTTTPSVWFASQPDSGYSVDNLAPSVPASLSLGGGTLSWEECPDGDFDYFTVYGSETPDLSGAVVVGYTTGTSFDASGVVWSYLLVTATDFAGNEGEAAVTDGATGVGETPNAFRLLGAAPNPFNPQTTIRYDLPRDARVSLCVYDLSGRLVRTLVNGEEVAAGSREAVWDGRSDAGRPVAAGAYFCRMEAGPFGDTIRMALVK